MASKAEDLRKKNGRKFRSPKCCDIKLRKVRKQCCKFRCRLCFCVCSRTDAGLKCVLSSSLHLRYGQKRFVSPIIQRECQYKLGFSHVEVFVCLSPVHGYASTKTKSRVGQLRCSAQSIGPGDMPRGLSPERRMRAYNKKLASTSAVHVCSNW
jgi:hypothetical protein